MRNLFRVLSIAVFLALGACGGDSSNDDAALFAAAAQKDKPVEGRAVKGVLQGAAVALRVQAGDSLVDYATTVTDDAGVFAFDTFPDEPFKLVVFAPLDGSARMLCDASSGCGDSGGHPLDTNGNGVFDFGEAMPLPADFSMTAWFAEPPADGALAVTPLTHLAATLAESYPGPVDARAIAVASATVATLFDLPADFATRWPVSVNDADELAGAGAADMQHALLAAGFAELATAGEMQAVLDAYASSLAGFGGQLPLSGGEGDLQALVEAAATMAQTLLGEGATLSETLAGLQSLVQRWSGTHTRVVTDVEVDADDMARARVVLDDLDHYLNLANINGQGQFFADQVGQLDWLYTQASLDFAETTIEAAGQIILVALVGDLIAEQYNLDVLDLSLNDLSVQLDVDTRVLTVTRDDGSQFVDISVNMDDIIAGAEAGALTYSLDGLVANDVVSGTMQGTLDIALYETDLLPVINVAHQLILENPEVSQQDLTDALLALLSELHGRATVTGDMALFKTADPDFAFSVSGSAWGEINVPAVDEGGDVLALEVSYGEIVSPWGDSLYSLEGETPALAVAVGQHGVLDARFGFEAFGMPAMEVDASGRLDNIGSVFQQLLDSLGAPGAEGDILALLGALDYSILDLYGSATLDIPADNKTYLLDLDGFRVDASLPNSVEQGIQFHLTSINGGYLYAGDSLVGSVTFDWANTGVTLFLLDGTVRSYFLGPLDDLLPAELLAGLQGLAG
jgi:hypothetical protein